MTVPSVAEEQTNSFDPELGAICVVVVVVVVLTVHPCADLSFKN